MTAELLGKYIWLVRTFVRAGDRGLDLGEIGRKWELRFGSPYPRRSFANHREAVEELFGVRIECDRTVNRYFIRYSGDVSDENSNAAWLINTFTVNNLLSLGKERLSGRVAVENIPSGQKWLTILMDAMTGGEVVEISYRKYTAQVPETLCVHPYAVKEFGKRWYLVGYCEERGAMRVYGLDRIVAMEVTGRPFEMPSGFDVDELFSGSYGIYLPEGRQPGKIVFRASEKEARYLRDLPLHPSQSEFPQRGEGDKPVLFSIKVIPNEDLLMKFCSYGDKLEILSPESFALSVASAHRKALDMYGTKL
ncbi:MAG: WYL domain-containing protein [Bacteroidales bacterium]|nr:WYL domain-containing protein [Bacteroidales bacterium]